MEERRDKIRKIFGLRWKKTPAHNTIRDILHSISEKELESSFRQHAKQLQSSKAQLKGGKKIRQIAFDGKALCGSVDPSIDKRFIQLLSGFGVEKKIILCHYEIDEKSNEIPAFQKLIVELAQLATISQEVSMVFVFCFSFLGNTDFFCQKGLSLYFNAL